MLTCGTTIWLRAAAFDLRDDAVMERDAALETSGIAVMERDAALDRQVRNCPSSKMALESSGSNNNLCAVERKRVLASFGTRLHVLDKPGCVTE